MALRTVTTVNDRSASFEAVAGPLDVFSNKNLTTVGAVAAGVAVLPAVLPALLSVNFGQVVATAVAGHVVRKEVLEKVL